MIAQTPEPPYYAVVFTSTLKENHDGYAEMAEKVEMLAKQQDGFLGIESARNELGVTVSYWKDLESIKKWKAHSVHSFAQEKGKSDWYKKYTVRIALVERDYSLEMNE